jgi:cbb3-type cytochrome oxidase subunit 3
MLADLFPQDTNWGLVSILVLQFITLAYVVYGFRSIARNQVEQAEYLKEMLEKDEP